MVERLASHYLASLPEVDVALMLPHPGDAEWLCGGVIALAAAAGKRVAILDLTAGEAGSFTRMDRKLDEADAAAAVLGVHWRGSMRLPDARLEDTIMSRMTVTGEIKRLRPSLLIAMAAGPGHPDRGPASTLVENAAYLAQLGRLDDYLAPHRVERLVFAAGAAAAPDFVVDISEVWEQKLAALRCYSTLFADGPEALARLEREARRLGDMIGVRYGEAFQQRTPLRERLF
jgi:LmbE family N-acetylglucosaminyl deacetylase